MSDSTREPTSDDVSPSALTTATDRGAGGKQQIGPYHLLHKLGEGGMGEVWLAEQTEPVQRQVALKIIKEGIDTERVVARFEAERQALALMDHPAIAKVYDAGTTPDGQLFYVMEHIRGEPITDYCDRHRLTNRERLDLFSQVCRGVQHAHQKAVIHRDLKPSNVLVTVYDDRPLPKIIDFGLAKATARKLTARPLHTHHGAILGTPIYMSPEQAEGLDIDTRTDVYALGVILYELLVGALPYDLEEEQRLEALLLRKLREDTPPRPSLRLSSLGGRSAQVAEHRQTQLSTLRRELSGDLDWIALRALENDRRRRYGSPHELAADIERYLTDQPVQASPPTMVYRAKKFVRRHRFGVGVATLLAVLLVAFAAAMAVQANRIARERDRANRQADVATQALAFLTGLFQVSDPSEARGNSITAREILDRGATRIAEELRDQPEVQSRLMATIGNVYLSLGLYSAAAPQLEQAADNLTRVLGPENPYTLHAKTDLSWLYTRSGRWDEAERIGVETLEIRRRVLGEDHPETLILKNNLGVLYTNMRRFEEAESIFTEVYEVRRRTLGAENLGTLMSLANLGWLYRLQGRWDEAERHTLHVLEARERMLGSDDPETLRSKANLFEVYVDQGRLDEAEKLGLEVLEARRRIIGPEHPHTVVSMSTMAALYASSGRHEEAAALFEDAIDIQRRTCGSWVLTAANLASVYQDMGENDRVVGLLREVIAEARTSGIGDRPDLLPAMGLLASALSSQRRLDECEEVLIVTVKLSRSTLGDECAETLQYLGDLAAVQLELGKLREAERLLRQALPISRRVTGQESPQTLLFTHQLGSALDRPGTFDDAQELLLSAVEGLRRLVGGDHHYTLQAMIDLGSVRAHQGLVAEARQMQSLALESLRRVQGDDHPSVRWCLYRLGCTEVLAGRRQEALDYLRQAVAAGLAHQTLLTSPDLESLRSEERFEAMVAKARARGVG